MFMNHLGWIRLWEDLQKLRDNLSPWWESTARRGPTALCFFWCVFAVICHGCAITMCGRRIQQLEDKIERMEKASGNPELQQRGSDGTVAE